MRFKIESDVEFYQRPRKPYHGKYPWLKMRVGDSFLCPVSSRQNIHQNARQAGVRIKTRRETKDKYRVWRIE